MNSMKGFNKTQVRQQHRMTKPKSTIPGNDLQVIQTLVIAWDLVNEWGSPVVSVKL